MEHEGPDPEPWRWRPPGTGAGAGPDPAAGRPAGAGGAHDADEARQPAATAHTDDLAGLFAGPSGDGAERGPRSGGRSRALLPGMAALAIVVVAAAAALLLRPPLDGTPAHRGPAGATGQADDGGVAAPGPTPGGAEPSMPPPPSTPASMPPSTSPLAAGAAAPAHQTAAGASAGRAAEQAIQAVRIAPAEHPRHVLHAAVAASTAVGALRVLTVDAVVVDAAAGAWGAPRRARFGVALRAADGAVVGRPWPLPPPGDAAEPAWEPLQDPDKATAVRQVLDTAGFGDLPADGQAIDLHHSEELPEVLRAELRARAPGAPAAERQQVWLRDGERPALLGHR